MYEAVPWGHEVHPFGTQLHGGWSNRRLTVLYHLNTDGVWTAVNKSYSTDFSRNKIVSRRFPYLVVTLFRRREMQQDFLGPAPVGEAPGGHGGVPRPPPHVGLIEPSQRRAYAVWQGLFLNRAECTQQGKRLYFRFQGLFQFL